MIILHILNHMSYDYVHLKVNATKIIFVVNFVNKKSEEITVL